MNIFVCILFPAPPVGCPQHNALIADKCGRHQVLPEPTRLPWLKSLLGFGLPLRVNRATNRTLLKAVTESETHSHFTVIYK